MSVVSAETSDQIPDTYLRVGAAAAPEQLYDAGTQVDSTIEEQPLVTTPTETHKQSRWRWAKSAACVAFGALAGLGIGDTLGSHEEFAGIAFTSRITFGTDILFDASPLAKVRIEAGQPGNAGVTISADSLSRDHLNPVTLAQFGDLEAVKNILKHGLYKDLGAFGLSGAALGLALAAMDRRQRKAYGITISATAFMMGAGLGVIHPSYDAAHCNWQQAGVFEGHDFSQLSFCGDLPEEGLAMLADNETAYDQLKTNVVIAAAQIKAEDEARGGYDTVAVADADRHCNLGMSRVVGALVTTMQADMLWLLGDEVFSGTMAENACIIINDQYLPNGLVKIALAGNHDSSITEDSLRDHGYIVLDGSVVKVLGINFLGDADPKRTEIGKSPYLRDPNESEVAFEQRLAQTAREFKGPHLIVLNHEPEQVEQIIEDGSADMVIDGHMHYEVAPQQADSGTWYYTAINSGGSQRDQPPVLGPLENNAGNPIFYLKDGEVQGMRTVYYNHVTGNVSYSSYVPLPIPKDTLTPAQMRLPE